MDLNDRPKTLVAPDDQVKVCFDEKFAATLVFNSMCVGTTVNAREQMRMNEKEFTRCVELLASKFGFLPSMIRASEKETTGKERLRCQLSKSCRTYSKVHIGLSHRCNSRLKFPDEKLTKSANMTIRGKSWQ
jgi:hypothetical protein